MRPTCTLLLVSLLLTSVALIGCDPAPPASEGLCCPIADSHACGSSPIPAGGWASSSADCEWHRTAFDVAYTRETDEQGCEVFVEDPSVCCNCVPDSGPVDSGVDSGIDSGAVADAGFDAGFDAGTDAGFDGGTDSGPPGTPTGTRGCMEDSECAEGICWSASDYDPLCSGTICSRLCLDDETCQDSAAAAGADNPSGARCGSDNRCDFQGTGLIFIACA